jgi:hydrogenase maturation protein HypF
MKHLASVGGLASQEVAAFKNMLARGVNSPLTSSAGRLFDVVAALIGLRQFTRFEGQAAMELEFALEETAADDAYPPTLAAAGEGGEPAPKGSAGSPMILDWAPMIHGVLADLEAGAAPGRISAKFHNSLVEIIVAAARCVGTSRVALSGGCFQNRYLTERSVHRLREAGFQPYWHQRVPPNDGGIALGQIIAARREER